jgi:hypothetical protein
LQRRARQLWALALFGLASAALVRAGHSSDLRRAWSASCGLGAPLLLLLALPSVSLFVKMLGWRALLPPSARPSLGRAYVAFVAAQGVNELGFSVLGEPLKVWVLAPSARASGVRAVVTDNLVAFSALLAVMATLLGSARWACVGAAIALAVSWQAYRARELGVLLAFSAHCVGKLWLVLEIGLGLYFFGEPALAAAKPLALSWLGAAALGAAVPAQLGVVEAALIETGAALGIGVSSLLGLALVRRLRGLVWLGIGLFLAARMMKGASIPSIPSHP